MRGLHSALAAFSLSSLLILAAATRIDDPKIFVTEVYRRYAAAKSASSYTPPDDIYTARLDKLMRDDKRRAKGDVGCLDFDFWVNGEDWKITNLTVTSTDEGQDRKTVIAKFRNTGEPSELHFDF